MRVTDGLLINNFLADLRRIQEQLASLQRMTATGKAFSRPGEDPVGVARSLDYHSSITWLEQYNRNIDDGLSRLEFTETSVYDVDTQLQRVRELTVQAANSYLTMDDRNAIANEIDQLLEHVISTANGQFRGRHVFSGYETLTQSFRLNSNTEDGLTNSITYQGDLGVIARNIGINRDLTINFNGKEIFTEQTYMLTGKQLPDTALGFSGTFEVNNKLFTVTVGMTTADIRDLLNADPDIEVHARIGVSGGLVLDSLNSSNIIQVKDILGTALSDLGITPEGAFNLGQVVPALPLIESRGAIHTSAAVGYPITLTTGTQDLVITVGGEAIGAPGVTQTKVLTLLPQTYNTAAELVAEIQAKADQAFGENVLIVNDMGGGVIEIETFVQSGLVTVADLQIGGTAPDGTVDSVSDIIGLNAVPSVQEVADVAGFDGNDRLVLDLGAGAYRVSDDEVPLDLQPIVININAAVALTVDSLVADINQQIMANQYLSGLVEAVNDGGRLRIQTTKLGSDVLASDLILSNAVPGLVVPATDTLGALGFYVDPLTGISDPSVPATVFSTAPYPPGIGAIVFGVNDQFSIDLGASSSNDGSNPDPETVTLLPGVYATAAALATEINNQIGINPVLIGAVEAVVRTSGGLDYVDIVTTKTGSRIQAEDLVLADVVVGTLANLGLGGATFPGGGTSAGQGDITEPHNIVDTLIKIRDELLGYAARDSRLVDLRDEDGISLGLFAGYTIRINSDGSSLDFIVQRFSTMQDLADKIEEKLGFGLEVQVLRNGKIEVNNPTSSTIFDISIEALNTQGQKVVAFEERMSTLSGKLFFNGVLRSQTVYEDERFQRMTNRIGDVDDGFKTILSALATLGSRNKRMHLTKSQNDNVRITLAEIQTKNDYVDMAEIITKLKAQENVLRASLGTGARIIPLSMFDFLR